MKSPNVRLVLPWPTRKKIPDSVGQSYGDYQIKVGWVVQEG
jgi:hypothetical protein